MTNDDWELVWSDEFKTHGLPSLIRWSGNNNEGFSRSTWSEDMTNAKNIDGYPCPFSGPLPVLIQHQGTIKNVVPEFTARNCLLHDPFYGKTQ